MLELWSREATQQEGVPGSRQRVQHLPPYRSLRRLLFLEGRTERGESLKISSLIVGFVVSLMLHYSHYFLPLNCLFFLTQLKEKKKKGRGMAWGYVSPTPPSLTLCELFLLTRQLSSRPPTYKVVLSINTDYSTFQQLRESLY